MWLAKFDFDSVFWFGLAKTAVFGSGFGFTKPLATKPSASSSVFGFYCAKVKFLIMIVIAVIILG